MSLAPGPEVALQIVDFDGSGYEGLLSDVARTFVEKQLPSLVSQATMRMPFPAFDVSAVPGVPDGTRLGVRQAELVHENGVCRLSGNIGQVE